MWQTSCWVYVDDCDDDDDGHHCHDDDDFDDDDFDDDDDDGHLSGSPLPSTDAVAAQPRAIADSDFRLNTFELIAAEADAAAHPVRRIVAIEGIVIGTAAALERPDAATFREFSSLLLAENQDLIGLPASAGRWVFDAVEFSTDETRVFYRQELRPLVHPALSGRSTGMLVFVFDRRGSLIEIDNSSRLRFD